MTDLDVSLASQFPAWLLVSAALVLLGTAAVFYLRVRRSIRKIPFIILVTLRVLAVVLLLLLFFDPVVSMQRTHLQRGDVAVLVDTSKSMRVHDPDEPQRLDRVKNELLSPRGLLERLSEGFNVSIYRFDSAAEAVETTEAVRALVADGEATNIAKAVRTVLARHNAADLAGVVVLTDGNDNASDDVDEALDDVRVPLIFVGVGRAQSAGGPGYKDVLITDVKTRPERFLTVNNKARVDVTLKSVGFRAVERTVVLTERGGQEKGRAAVVLGGENGTARAVIEIVPTKVGKFVYDLAVSPDPDERFRDNNSQSITVHVVDPKIRVLLVDKPRSEYKQLRWTLSRDPNVTLMTLVNEQAGKFTQGGDIPDVGFAGFPETREQLSGFDVVILGSVKRVYFSDAQLEALRDFVRDGRGLLMLGGTESFGAGGWGGTAMDEVLPVVSGAPGIGEERALFLPSLTAEGKRHPVFAGCEPFFGGGRDARLELRGYNRIARVLPGATVLAVNPNDANAPILVVRNYGKGRAAAFTSTGTYLWYRLMTSLGDDSPYVRFWGQMVRWLSSREATERALTAGITATIDKDYFDPGERVPMVAHVRDADGLATDRAEVLVTITSASGALIRRQMPWDREVTSYVDEIEPPGPGEYTAKFGATLDGSTLGEAEASFTVGKPSLETEKVALNETLLQELASREGRKYLQLVGVAAVEKELRPFIRRRIQPLQFKLTPTANTVLFALFALCLSAEWVLRKRWQLL